MNDAESPLPPAEPSNKLPVTALIAGIVSIAAPLGMPPAGVIFGLAAIVVGAVARSRVRQGTATGSRTAMAGIACGALGIVSSVVVFLLAFVLLPPS